jgi:hypothetical protein
MSLFKKLGKVLKAGVKAVSLAAPFIPGPLGAVAKGISTIAGQVSGIRTPPSMAYVQSTGPARPGIGMGMNQGGFFPAVLPAIRAGLPAVVGAGRAIAKSGVVRFTRQQIKQLGLFIAGGFVVDSLGKVYGQAPKRRRMNPLNARALNRAINRVYGANKICKQVHQITGGKKRPKRC